MAELLVRPALAEDRRLVSSLLATCRWRHNHLDWQEPVDLLGEQPFLVAESGSVFLGLLACPEGPEGVAWIRVLALAMGTDPAVVWSALWEEAAGRLSRLGTRHAASLESGPWQRPLLARSGFRETSAVVFFERSMRRIPHLPPSPAVFQEFKAADLDPVVGVDHLAFQPLWRVSAGTLKVAHRSASEATLAVVDGKIVGYQITTISPLGAHLARLAVDPSWQKRGIGSALVVRLLIRLEEQGVTRITLNTQSDNRASQDLYRKLGFHETGERLPVHEIHW